MLKRPIIYLNDSSYCLRNKGVSNLKLDWRFVIGFVIATTILIVSVYGFSVKELFGIGDNQIDTVAQEPIVDGPFGLVDDKAAEAKEPEINAAIIKTTGTKPSANTGQDQQVDLSNLRMNEYFGTDSLGSNSLNSIKLRYVLENSQKFYELEFDLSGIGSGFYRKDADQITPIGNLKAVNIRFDSMEDATALYDRILDAIDYYEKNDLRLSDGSIDGPSFSLVTTRCYSSKGGLPGNDEGYNSCYLTQGLGEGYFELGFDGYHRLADK